MYVRVCRLKLHKFLSLSGIQCHRLLTEHVAALRCAVLRYRHMKIMWQAYMNHIWFLLLHHLLIICIKWNTRRSALSLALINVTDCRQCNLWILCNGRQMDSWYISQSDHRCSFHGKYPPQKWCLDNSLPHFDKENQYHIPTNVEIWTDFEQQKSGWWESNP